MKRKDVSARILTGVLAFSMVAATGTPSMAVFAAEESAVEAEQITGEEVKSENETAQEYQYAYAALSWAEYWKNEDVYNAGSTESSAEEDAKGELDKGAFDTVSRATTNHGLHRGSYQCTSEITMKDGTKLKVAYYTGVTAGVLTDGNPFSYNKKDIESYVVTGLK